MKKINNYTNIINQLASDKKTLKHMNSIDEKNETLTSSMKVVDQTSSSFANMMQVIKMAR
jgi:hypothetical protein